MTSLMTNDYQPYAPSSPSPVAGQPQIPRPVPAAPAPVPGNSVPLAHGPANPALQAPTSFSGGNRVVPTSQSPATPAVPAPASAPIPLAASSTSAPYANTQTTVPGSATDYTGQTITPGPGTDRLALAKSNFENFRDSTEPEFQAALRDASQQAAGAGQIGSGMARGRLGDIGTARARDLQSAATSNLNNATEGGIEDAYRNIGIAQQQQGYQSGEQSKAFDQAQRQQALDEALRNGDFERYYQLLQAGNAGNPADVQLALAGGYGAQSSAAGASAGGLANSAVRNPYQVPLAA